MNRDRVVDRVVVVAEGDLALTKEQPQTVVSGYFVQEELDAVLEELSEVFSDNPRGLQDWKNEHYC